MKFKHFIIWLITLSIGYIIAGDCGIKTSLIILLSYTGGLINAKNL